MEKNIKYKIKLYFGMVGVLLVLFGPALFLLSTESYNVMTAGLILLAIILATPLAVPAAKIIQKIDYRKFNKFTYFVLSSLILFMVWGYFDEDFKNIAFNDLIIYLILIPLLVTLVIYLKWKTSIVEIVLKFITLSRHKSKKTILVDAVYCFIVEGSDGSFGIYPEMHRLLEEFPNPKIILTGAPDDKIKTYGLDRVPYPYFTLKQNPPKSDPAYYQKMLAHFGLKPEDVVYFEHNAEAVASAKSVGINTYYWDNVKKPLADLKTFLENNL